MGLEQYIRDGAKLQRNNISLTTTEDGSGSVNLGSAYVLMNISTTAPCRLRLYDNLSSLQNIEENARGFNDTNISPSVALVGDFSMSAAGTYTIDPVVYGIVENTAQKLTYYQVNNTQSGAYPVISFTRYLMEDSVISIANRVTLPPISAALAPTEIASGTLYNVDIPRTYLLVSASVSSLTGPSVLARVRLYMTSESLNNATEKSRPFSTEPAVDTKLIVDAFVSSSETTYFIPKIAGANLQTIGTSLSLIKRNQTAMMGVNQIYYILENPNTTGGTVSTTASIHVFSLED